MSKPDPNAGTDGPSPSWDIKGQEGVDGSNAPVPPKAPDAKRRGRPRAAEEPLGSVTVHLPTPAQDRIIRLASQRKQTVSEYLRDVMIQLFMNRS